MTYSCLFKPMNSILSQFRAAIMGISMVFVIMFHQQFISGSIPFFFHKTGYLGVDAFLFISGFGIYFSLNKYNTINTENILSFYKRRMLRMMPTCIIAGISFLYLWMVSIPGLYYSGSLNFYSAFIGLDVWYIRTIMIYYLLAPFLYSIIKSSKFTIITLIVLCLVIPFIGKGCSWLVGNVCGNSFYMQQTIGWTIERFPVFAFGMLFAHMNPDRNNFLNWKFIMFAIACVGLLLATPYIYKLNHFQSYSIYKFLRILIGHKVLIIPILPILFYLAIFILENLGKYIKSTLEWIGNYSLEIFLAHSAIFPYARKMFDSGWLIFTCALAASVLASIYLKYVSAQTSSIFTRKTMPQYRP